jgi:hypothetical protein
MRDRAGEGLKGTRSIGKVDWEKWKRYLVPEQVSEETAVPSRVVAYLLSVVSLP